MGIPRERSPSTPVEMVFIGLMGKKAKRWKRDLEKCLVQPGETVNPRRDPFGSYLKKVVG